MQTVEGRIMRPFAKLLAGALLAFASAPLAAAELPHLVHTGGKHALIVDGQPFLMLGAQTHNSSNYPAMLPRVWPTVHALHANTLEIPVAWEQIEPREGHFDFSWLDTLIPQARANNVRLVLLWFGTWKNTGPSYTPEWVKGDPKRFPRMMTKEGKTHYVLSPHSRTTLEADKRAFVAVMHHIREIDPQHTVIMVQVENETGSYGSPRDFSAVAQRLFEQPIPAALARRIGKNGTWSQAFGWKADQAFNAWYTARYVDEVAAAGQAELNLPMYVNAALGDAFKEESAQSGASGGPNWNVIDIWKAAAPHIAIEAPDIYDRDARAYARFVELYGRPDNPLFIPETSNAAGFARFLWLALGKGTIGFSPFGMDGTGDSNFPLGAESGDSESLEAFASKFRLLQPIAQDWARLSFEHPTNGFARGQDAAPQSITMGRWKMTAQYALWPFGEPEWTGLKMPPHPDKDRPVGGAALIQLGSDEFLLAGDHIRIRFGLDKPQPGESSQFLSVEEGTFENGRWIMTRRWNGDQIDYGLNLTRPVLLKVRMGTYR
jgi:beta-galactosidase GanA